jgi:hypothetical protein
MNEQEQDLVVNELKVACQSNPDIEIH